MVELPKTEEELQAYVNQKLEEQKTAHEKELNETAYKARKDAEAKLEKYKADMKLSEEERAQKLAEEKAKAVEEELNGLRAFKKTAELKERLEKEKLPSYFANDSRLLNAKEGELDNAIKVVKGEYEASLPKGNANSSVVNTATGGPVTKDENKGLESMADAIKQIIS